MTRRYIKETKSLAGIRKRLFGAPSIIPFSKIAWYNDVERQPGIYAIIPKRKGSKPVYIGQSSNLSERFKDLGNPANHTFARKIKMELERITGRHEHISTTEIKNKIRNKYRLHYLVLEFGRAEAEEFLITYYKTYDPSKYNRSIPRRWRCDT